MGEIVGFTEEVGHSVSEEILPPAYKRFNSSSPLITLSDPAEAVKKCLCVCVCMCVSVCLRMCVIHCIQRKTRGVEFRSELL